MGLEIPEGLKGAAGPAVVGTPLDGLLGSCTLHRVFNGAA